MAKFFDALVSLLPFTGLLESWGLAKETSTAISLLLSTFISALVAMGAKNLSKWAISHYKNAKLAKDLAPHFDYQKVQNARQFFIPTQYQNHSPTHEEEPGFSHQFVSKSPLIPFFMKIAFNEKKESNKFYLILADSGMGKTTFMINLYMKYTSVFNFRRKYKIRLLPFGDGRILERIKKIDEKEVPDTILLLDAFDEDKALIPPETPDGLSDGERFRRRLDDIIETVRDFREVVITSRTQYFPGQEDRPYELKIPRFDDQGFHTLAKFYLSPFDAWEIRHYLHKKYGRLRFWQWGKKKMAQKIVENSPKLMVRPMLLSYIDYLVESERSFENTYQIYETLVEKWLDREAKKRKYKTDDREKFKQDLQTYSQLVALEIYRRQRDDHALDLEKNAAIAIAEENQIELRGYEITGQSLLTRDGEGNWKFAHKSIFEFFIAKKVATDWDFLKDVLKNGFANMDMAQQFCQDILPVDLTNFVPIPGGSFIMGSPETEVDRSENETQHEVKLDPFWMAKYQLTVTEFEKFIAETNYQTDAEKEGSSHLWTGKKWIDKSGINWRHDSSGKIQKDKKHPVVHISWQDAAAYCEWATKECGFSVRLPTEAEWEYACRAGSTTPFNTGENLSAEQANYNGNYPYRDFPKGKFIGKTTPVGSYPPNAWGLYDMHGNVWEWCADWYGGDYYEACKKEGTVANPEGPAEGSYRVLRGGSWFYFARDCRVAYRSDFSPGNRGFNVGFRLVFVP